jgi:hypothetical protein
MQELWRTRARVPIRPRDDGRRFHQASGAWNTGNGEGHAKWWMSSRSSQQRDKNNRSSTLRLSIMH